jgi:4-hydroxyphenylpyruvate dioxygenase
VERAAPTASARRAEALLAPVLPRTRGAAEADLSAIAAPDGTEVFFTRTGPGHWSIDFLDTGARAGDGAGLTGIDHVGLTQPFDSFDEAALFYRAVLGLDPEAITEVAAPFGLVRGRTVTTPDRSVRLALSVSLLRRGGWAPGVPAPQHVAFATDDIVATARRLRATGAPLLAVPANYHDDLDARVDLDPALLASMRECGLLYDEDARGSYLHLYTEVLGSRVFFEVVQRIGGYDGYGTVNAPVRMSAHRHVRTGSP